MVLMYVEERECVCVCVCVYVCVHVHTLYIAWVHLWVCECVWKREGVCPGAHLSFCESGKGLVRAREMVIPVGTG